MTSGISGVFLHVFSSSEDKKENEITKQRAQLREMVEIATNHLKDCQYNQAKTNFLEAKSYLKNCKKRDEMSLPEELDFYINVVICYSFTMELDSIKDLTKEDFIKEDHNMRNEIDDLIKQYPKRHFPLFLRLLYSFKKECWREAIYYCELVQNFEICPEEEKKYKSTPIFTKDLIPELDLGYCSEVVHNIEEAAIYGLVEKVAKLDEQKNPKASLIGFNWVNLWSKDCNDKIIKRLRSYKKPMNPLQLHKLFHTEILPKFYTLNKNLGVGKSLFCYYKKEFMYQCEECLRAKLQLESRNELFGRLCEQSSDDNMSDDSDLFDTDEDEDDDDDLDSQNGDALVLPPNSQEKDTNDKESCECKSEAKKETEQEKEKVAEKVNTKKTLKSQQTQTEKVKVGHRYVQTDCSMKKKSIAIQTDCLKPKKLEKEKPEEFKCTKCTESAKLYALLQEIKKQLSLSKAEMTESIQDQFNDLLKQIKEIKEENSNLKNHSEKDLNKSFEIIQSKEIIAKLEKQILLSQETFDKERKELSEKNVFLQKLLMDQMSDKYILYKNIYSGLENNCRVIIGNVTELQNFLTTNSVPNAKDNRSYLSRWEKTLSDLQRKNAHLKAFYKKTKSQMLHLSEYECNDWPDVAEIPVEAFGFLFENLKQNVNNVGIAGGQPKSIPQYQQAINRNTPPPPQNQAHQMHGGHMFPMPAVPPNNIRPYVGAGIRYGSYQPPPPPIPMPQHKNQNAQYPPWVQNNHPNAQVYTPTNQWPSNPNLTAYFKGFNSNDFNQKQTGIATTTNSNQVNKSQIITTASQEGQNTAFKNIQASNIWNAGSINPNLNKSTETSTSQNQNAAESQRGNMVFSGFSNFKTMSTSSISDFLTQSIQDDKAEKGSSTDKATLDEQKRENLIEKGFWDFDDEIKETCKAINPTEDDCKDAGKHDLIDDSQVFDNQETENARKSEATSISSPLEKLSEKIIQRPVRPLPKLVNVCKDEDSQYDPEKELFQYLKSQCSDVDNDELMSTILKVLKKYNGSFSSVSKTELLKEVRSSILSTKHGVCWITPKSIIDWAKNDHPDSHCSICFDDLSQRPKCVLPCKHEYHKDCISQWLRTNSICPICRVHSVVDEDYPPLS